MAVSRKRAAMLMCVCVSAGAVAPVGMLLCAPSQAAAAGKAVIEQELPGGDRVHVKGNTYDFRSAGAEKSGRLWIPPNVKVVKGVVVDMNAGGVSGDNKAFAGDTNLQMFAARNHFALLGIGGFRGNQMYDKGGADTIFYMLDLFGKAGSHPELANVPFIMHGSSNGGMATYGTVNNRPERCICFASNVGPRFTPAKATDAAIKVPGIFIVGPQDRFFGKDSVPGVRGIEDMRAMIYDIRARHGLWSWIAEQDKGHETRNILDVNMKFYEKAIKARLPAGADPRKGPVKLNDIPEESGWLTNAEVCQSELTTIAPFNEYPLDKAKAGWILDQDVAFLHRGLSTYKSPVSLKVKEYYAARNIHVGPSELMVVANPTVKPRETITVQVDVAKLARWDSIEVFNGAQKLGTVASGAAPELKVTIRPEPQVYAIDVLVHDGATRYTAIPFHLIVEDPAIKTQIVAVRSQSQVKPPKKVLGSKTAGAPKGPATTTAPNKEDAALTVYGLTKAQEQQFKAGDGALSAFWKEFTEQHDQVLLTPAKNGGDPKTWKSVFQTLPDTPSLGGNDDISVRVLAARSAAGLYLLFEVTDDQWYQSTDNRLEFDVLDVCFDARSPSDMWTGPWQRSFLNGGWSVSMSTRQIQSWTGEKELLAKVFRYGFPDPWQMGGGVYSVADGAKEFGIAFDAVQVSPTLRAQEWFIPWDELGRKAEPALGERMGFAPGYNDMDPSQHDGLRDSDGNIMHDRLRWPERSGPWGHPSSKGPNPDPWGVLEMGGML